MGAALGAMAAYSVKRALEVATGDGRHGTAAVAAGLLAAALAAGIQRSLRAARPGRLSVIARLVGPFAAIALVTPVMRGGWPAVVGFCSAALAAFLVVGLAAFVVMDARRRRDPAGAEQRFLRSPPALGPGVELFTAIPGHNRAVDALWGVADAFAGRRAGSRAILLAGDDEAIKPALALATARRARAAYADFTDIDPDVVSTQLAGARGPIVCLVRDIDGPDADRRTALVREIMAGGDARRRLVIATSGNAARVEHDGVVFDPVLEVATPAPAATASAGAVQAQTGLVQRLSGMLSGGPAPTAILGAVAAVIAVVAWAHTHPNRPLPHTLTAVVATPPASDRLADPSGASCIAPGAEGLTVAGLVHALASNSIPAVAWSPSASGQFGWVAGGGALGYVTNPPGRRVPPDGLFVIGVYRTNAAAAAAWAQTGRMPELGRKLGAMPLPAGTLYRSLNENDNLVVFQLLDTSRNDDAVIGAISDADMVCELDGTG